MVAGGSLLVRRSTPVAFTFAVTFFMIAILARAVSVTTTGPWFTGTLSIFFYSVSLIAGLFVAVGVTAFASHRASGLDAALSSLDLEIATNRRNTEGREGAEGGSGLSGGIGEVLGRLETLDATGRGGSEPSGHDSILASPTVYRTGTAEPAEELVRELTKQRNAIRTSRDRVWPTVAGPITLALLFVTIAGAMLPGAEGFAGYNYQLNTMLILMIAYSWWLLGAWLVLSLILLPTAVLDTKVFRPRLWERVE